MRQIVSVILCEYNADLRPTHQLHGLVIATIRGGNARSRLNRLKKEVSTLAEWVMSPTSEQGCERWMSRMVVFIANVNR